ncbi:hypothetical protein KQI38_17845 [Tissierella carlieri]|uniref:Uncharacterized protein n=1 Tax=Tissierella carlieri TaxID=689904 RepID=A0ABT1SAN8_9FIRM|nr:hypothetical protein [Tissierella carlieri]MBU5313893.1 hypothetical protein [Tissierella carlieri]MCQ4923543.1 hypothetical protein [Tissierella carlieri]
MKNKIKRIGIGLSAIVILLGATRVFSEPGSELDPLVTLSYVEKKIEQLKYYVDTELGKKNTGNETTGSWAVVEVPAGKSLICKDGTEIILRSGEARAIAIVVNGVMNGLTDITVGKDLAMEENIIANHLLIIPRDDGRGARALTNSFFLVKGDYEIR